MKYVSAYFCQFQCLGCVPLNGHNTYHVSNPMLLGVWAVSDFSVLELML